MNPFQRLGVKISNWWRGEPQDSGGVVTLNSPSFLERIGLKRKAEPCQGLMHRWSQTKGKGGKTRR